MLTKNPNLMQYFVHSEAGHAHLNEDCARAQIHPHDKDALICILADGQGGQFGGGPAARVAVQKCLDLALNYAPAQLLERQIWREILRGADEAVEENNDAGFTTLIGLCVTPSRVCGASCGDSAALLVEADNYGELTIMQRKNPPTGSGRATPSAFDAERTPNAPLLMMSDGVWKFVGFERIAALANSYRDVELVWQLRELQLSGNGGKLPDDFSIIAVW